MNWSCQLVATAAVLALAAGRADDGTDMKKLAKERWRAELANLFTVDKTKEPAIEAHMKRISRDHAILYLGGTGARIHYYLLDDVHQVVFHLAGQDGVLSEPPQIEDRQIWIKDRDGSLISYPRASK